MTDTFFAPADRAGPERIRQEAEEVSRNPALDGVLRLGGGLLLILDAHRQVVAVNHALLRDLGVDDSGDILGLRPGEVLGCVHAGEEPAGCGTTIWCRSCGAAIAIVATLSEGCAAQRKCAITVNRDGRNDDLCFLVRATPVDLRGGRFVLVLLRDITANERMAALERAFFHDINNTIMSLHGGFELLAAGGSPDPSLLAMTRASLRRLVSEVEIQRGLVREGADAVHARWRKVSVADFLAEMEQCARSHPAARGRRLTVLGRDRHETFTTDPHLLGRIILNMLVNAFEASEDGDEVVLAARGTGGDLGFEVHNRQVIPADVRPRIFQRHFSTKTGRGRGVGTCSMKLLGEKILGGRVGFSSSPETGTTFVFRVSPAGGTVPPAPL